LGNEAGTDTRVYAATSTASTFHFRRLDGSFSLYARQGLSREANKQEGESKKGAGDGGKRTTMTMVRDKKE